MDVKGKAGGNRKEAVNNSNSKTPKIKSQASSKEVISTDLPNESRWYIAPRSNIPSLNSCSEDLTALTLPAAKHNFTIFQRTLRSSLLVSAMFQSMHVLLAATPLCLGNRSNPDFASVVPQVQRLNILCGGNVWKRKVQNGPSARKLLSQERNTCWTWGPRSHRFSYFSCP